MSTNRSPRFFYQGPLQNEALARMGFLVDAGHRAGLLLGDAGTGKSLLLEVFHSRQRGLGRDVALINLVATDRREFLWNLAAALRLSPAAGDDEFRLARRLGDGIAAAAIERRPVVLLFDNADEASPEVLAQAARIANSAAVASDRRPTTIFAARPSSVSRLGERILENVFLRIELGPWDELETDQFLRASRERKGSQSAAFDPEAVGRLHQLSHGIPRRVARLADLAALAGTGSGMTHIDSQTVQSVYEELASANP